MLIPGVVDHLYAGPAGVEVEVGKAASQWGAVAPTAPGRVPLRASAGSWAWPAMLLLSTRAGTRTRSRAGRFADIGVPLARRMP